MFPALRQENRLEEWKPLAVFLVLAFSIAWIIWLPVLLGPQGLHLTRYDASLAVFVSTGTVGPLIASFIATRYERGCWAMPSRFLPAAGLRYWMCLLLGPALTIIAFVNIPYLICVAPGHKLIHLAFLTPLLAVWPNILGGPLEEEFGWRGYLLPRLSERIGNTWGSLAVGVIWASWHLPLILTHVWGVSFWYYLPMVVAVAVFNSLAYFATGGSILGPIIVHYVFNTCSTMFGAAIDGQPLYRNRDPNAVILSSMACLALVILVVTWGRLGESKSGLYLRS